MGRHVVVGKGPVGGTLAEQLTTEGHQVVVISRSGGASPLVEHVALDAADAAALARAAQGADALYNCANPAYTRWTTDWPPIAAAVLDAATATGAVLVTMGNLYGYGRVDGPVREDLPLAPTGAKGRVRVQMWRDALAAHEAGRARVVEARAADFVGPGVTDGGFLGTRVLPRIAAGKSVQVLGDPDAPHSFTDVRDVARTLARMGTDARTWGRAWHVPTAPAVTTREAVAALSRALGVEPVPVRMMPTVALRAAGLVVPMVRELRETEHQRTGPFVLDSSAWTTAFGQEPTPLEQTWADTAAWWRASSTVPLVA